jgi:hypothetical protein
MEQGEYYLVKARLMNGEKLSKIGMDGWNIFGHEDAVDLQRWMEYACGYVAWVEYPGFAL